MQTASIPGAPATLGPYNLSFFIHNEKQTKELVDELFAVQNTTDETEEDISNSNNTSTEANNSISNTTTMLSENNENKNIKIELLNGSGDSTLLTKATNKLKEQGYNVTKTGTTTVTSKTSIVNKTGVLSNKLSDIQKLIGVGIISNSTSSTNTVDVTIVLGKDYE